jgi:DNA-binding beta-propeller fold protein YncE
MDRLAGTQPASESGKVLFQLGEPYGMAMDSKNNLYVADQKVGAVFIFNTETREADLIKNKQHAHFVRIIGLAIDDGDRLFVSDPGLNHVLVFDANHTATDVVIEPGSAMPSVMTSVGRTGCCTSPISSWTRFSYMTPTRSNCCARWALQDTITN